MKKIKQFNLFKLLTIFVLFYSFTIRAEEVSNGATPSPVAVETKSEIENKSSELKASPMVLTGGSPPVLGLPNQNTSINSSESVKVKEKEAEKSKEAEKDQSKKPIKRHGPGNIIDVDTSGPSVVREVEAVPIRTPLALTTENGSIRKVMLIQSNGIQFDAKGVLQALRNLKKEFKPKILLIQSPSILEIPKYVDGKNVLNFDLFSKYLRNKVFIQPDQRMIYLVPHEIQMNSGMGRVLVAVNKDQGVAAVHLNSSDLTGAVGEKRIVRVIRHIMAKFYSANGDCPILKEMTKLEELDSEDLGYCENLKSELIEKGLLNGSNPMDKASSAGE